MCARRHSVLAEGIILLVMVALFSACSSGSTRASGGSSPNAPRSSATPAALSSTTTFSPSTCTDHTSAKALAWVANHQVVGSVNGGPPTTLSHFVYPLGLPDEGQAGSDQLSAIVWAPDAKHLAVVVTLFLPMEQSYYPYVVDTTTHAVTRVLLPGKVLLGAPNDWVPWRLLAWADAHTLLIFAGGSTGGSENTVSYSYDLSRGTISPLLGITSAAEGVVRSGTLFYLDLTPVKPMGSDHRFSKGSALVHRYNMSSHTEIGTPVRLGDTFSNAGSEGNITIPGWDASPDVAQIAYERLTVTLPTSGTLMETAQFFAAHADGSSATPILTGMTPPPGTFDGALLAISPNGLLVAATHAGSTPDVVSGNVSGGPAHFYTPSVAGPPTWLATNCGFEADMGDGPGLGIEGFTLNAGSATAQGFTAVPTASTPAILA